MDNMSLQPVYIVGATASGKSDLALKLADVFDSVIISADSMQIYRGLDVGTAKVSKELREKYEHKMIDIVEYDSEFSVAEYSRLAKQEIDDALNRKKLPIVVGGTGLYFHSLIYPMSFANTSKHSELREKLQNRAESEGAEVLHRELEQLDPETASRLPIADVKRVIRALEIVITTGKPLSEQKDENKVPEVLMIGIEMDRTLLYDRINARVDKMFEMGLPNEVLSFNNFDCQSMQAIGYKEFKGCRFELVDGKYHIEEVETIKDKIKQHTRNYAKRQITWFKRYDFIKWFDFLETDKAIEFIKQKLLR